MRARGFSLIAVFVLALVFSNDANAQKDPIAHRKCELTVKLTDQNGSPVSNANLDVQMKRHFFRFGSQIRDRFTSITESEFNSLTEFQRQLLLPNLSQFGIPPYIPIWQDVLNYRQAIVENFNHFVPTIGMQWLVYENNGPAVPDAALAWGLSNGLVPCAASVVWQRDAWPTPEIFRSDANPDPFEFHSALINDRLGASGVMARFSNSGAGATINEWKLLNEPIHTTYFWETFVDAGIFNSELEALNQYFVLGQTTRPDAILSINEFNIFNWSNDDKVIEYRDLINDLLAMGTPIHRIGVQAHMSMNVSKEDMKRRLDILAETGLDIEITEFDTRDDANQLTPNEQEQIFRDVLEVAFEHTSVVGFIMWGFWDPGHWRGNGPLFELNWNVKAEAAPWFDLVRGQWMTSLTNQSLDASGTWMAMSPGVIKGSYDFSVELGNGSTFDFGGFQIHADSEIVLSIPVLCGDVNLDGDLNLLDVAPFVELLSSGSYLEEADINFDGTVDLLDVNPFVAKLSG